MFGRVFGEARKPGFWVLAAGKTAWPHVRHPLGSKKSAETLHSKVENRFHDLILKSPHPPTGPSIFAHSTRLGTGSWKDSLATCETPTQGSKKSAETLNSDVM